jgi:hypothetical protein
MKRLLCVLAVLAGGCNGPLPPNGPPVKLNYAFPLNVTPLGYAKDGERFEILELTYGSRKHVFLRSYEYNTGISVVKVGEYPIDPERTP